MRAKKRVWSMQRIGFKSTTLCYPLLALLGFSIWYGLDVQIGVIMSVAVTIILFRSTATYGLDADV